MLEETVILGRQGGQDHRRCHLVEPDPSGAPAAPDRQGPQEISIAIDKLKRGRGLRRQFADWIVDEVDGR